MNFGIITSYLIAGIVLLSILSLNFRVSESSGELTMSRVVKQHVTDVSDIVAHDFSKIGYNWLGSINDPIQTADSTKIVFFSNIDNDTGNTQERVTWTFGNSNVSSTDNPNDRVLTRQIVQGSTVVSKTDIIVGVTKFRLHYYSTVGSTTPLSMPVANPENIKQVEVELVIESGNKFIVNPNSDGRYVSSTWHKRFSPINIQDN